MQRNIAVWNQCSACVICSGMQELSLLQDRVPAFESARAIAIVEKELGGPLTGFFSSFDRNPIAAASLGQVTVGGPSSGELCQVCCLARECKKPCNTRGCPPSEMPPIRSPGPVARHIEP